MIRALIRFLFPRLPLHRRYESFVPPMRYRGERLRDFRDRQVDAVLVRAEFEDEHMWIG